MSSVDSNSNIIDLKEGHAKPAIKLAGGVRVKPSKHHPNEKARSNSESMEDVDEQELTSTSPKQTHPIISGAQTRGNEDFRPEAIKVYHEKPVKVSNDYRNGPKNTVIQQPKKF